MIEIDDAGGGCFLGPEVLVIHNLTTSQVYYLMIPPQIIQRVPYATKILKKAFRDLKISKNEPIKLCRGEIFDLFQNYLTEKGYQVVREKVSSQTDALAEQHFMEILYSYGLPRNVRLQERNYQGLYELVGYWFFTEGRGMSRLSKARIKPPYRLRKMAQRYPNLVKLLLKNESIAI